MRLARSSRPVLLADALDLAALAETVAQVPHLAALDRQGAALVREVFLLLYQEQPEIVAKPGPLAPLVEVMLDSDLVADLRTWTVLGRYESAIGTICLANGLLLDQLKRTDAADVAQGGAVFVEWGASEAVEKLKTEREVEGAWGFSEADVKALTPAERVSLRYALSDDRIRRWLQLVGRLREIESSLRGRKVNYIRDEMIGIELSDRLADALSSELAQQRHPLLRLGFLERLAEGTLLTQEYQGVEPVGKGDIVLVLDESGSMRRRYPDGGTPEGWAKSVLIALLDRAKAERRGLVVIGFAGRGQQQVWRFPRGQGSPALIVDLFTHQPLGASTYYEEPLEMVLDEVGEGSDVVFLTDDQGSVSRAWLAEVWLPARERIGFRVFGLSLATTAGSAMRQCCDVVHEVMDLTDPEPARDLLRAV